MRPDTWEDLSLTKLRNNLSESLRNVLKAKRYFNDRLGSTYPLCKLCSTELSVFTVERSFKSEETKEEEEKEEEEEEG